MSVHVCHLSYTHTCSDQHHNDKCHTMPSVNVTIIYIFTRAYKFLYNPETGKSTDNLLTYRLILNYCYCCNDKFQNFNKCNNVFRQLLFIFHDYAQNKVRQSTLPESSTLVNLCMYMCSCHRWILLMQLSAKSFWYNKQNKIINWNLLPLLLS